VFLVGMLIHVIGPMMRWMVFLSQIFKYTEKTQSGIFSICAQYRVTERSYAEASTFAWIYLHPVLRPKPRMRTRGTFEKVQESSRPVHKFEVQIMILGHQSCP
jgi:hypothetical protein